MELEEEDEVQAMNQFKIQFDQRKLEEHIKHKRTLDQEQTRFTKKDELLDFFREKEVMRQQAFKVVQVYNISRLYISNVLHHSLLNVYHHNYYQNSFQNNLQNTFLDWLYTHTTSYLNQLNTLSHSTQHTTH